MKKPVRVTVTGAAGQISYSLIFRIAAGEMLGADQPVILQLLEITPAMQALQGVVMEINDCAFPLVQGVVATDKLDEAFEGSDVCLLVGARPRGPPYSGDVEPRGVLRRRAGVVGDSVVCGLGALRLLCQAQGARSGPASGGQVVRYPASTCCDSCDSRRAATLSPATSRGRRANVARCRWMQRQTRERRKRGQVDLAASLRRST